jgi:aminopeptidase
MTSTTAFAKGQFTQTPEFEKNLDHLAEVAVRVGLGLGPGQELVMTATLDAVPLTRLIIEHAYQAGASLVTTFFSDEQSALLRFRYAPDASFDAAPSWLYEGMAQAYRNGAARLAIAGNDPSLLSKEDPEKVSRVNRAVSKAYRPALEMITRHEINWTILACATPAWAAAVFPDLPPDEALARLWSAIFAASRGPARSSRRVERARRALTLPRRHAEQEALCRPTFSRTRNRSSRRTGRRSPLARRRHNGGKWTLLRSQSPHRGSFHHAA